MRNRAPKTQLLADKDLWAAVDRVARSNRGSVSIATAYVGPDSLAKFKLRRGDSIHCALSIANAKCGAVYAADLIELQRRKVRIFASPTLHAKVFLFDRTAIVGSANVSKRSRQLDEAAILTNDPAIVASVRKWFERRQQAAEASARLLEECKRAYRTPKWFALTGGGGSSQAHEPSGRKPNQGHGIRWWILRDVVEHVEYDADDDRAAARGQAKALARDKSLSDDDLYPLRWPVSSKVAREVQRDDWVIQLVRRGKRRHRRFVVLPATRVHAVTRYTNPRKGPRLVMSLEKSSGDIEVPLPRFLKAAKSSGIDLTGRTQAVDDPRIIRELERLCSTKGLRRLRD